MTVLRLKEVLKEKGITGKDLAKSVGVSAVSVSNIVQGSSFPKTELLLKIAKALDVDIRDLFVPTKEENLLNGFIEFQEKIYRILTVSDLKKLLEKVS